MKTDWLIIDGYNLLHQVDVLAEIAAANLMSARQRLVRMIERTAHRLAPQTTIVFDGRDSGQDASLTSPHLEVFFSPGNLTADTVIERLVSKYDYPERITVVTSDRAEHETVSSAGANVMSAQEFIAQCEKEARRPRLRSMRPGERPQLGDLFPDDW